MQPQESSRSHITDTWADILSLPVAPPHEHSWVYFDGNSRSRIEHAKCHHLFRRVVIATGKVERIWHEQRQPLYEEI